MILTAFDEKFDEKTDEIPPGACRPPNKLKKNNVDKADHQKVKNKQCRKSGPNKKLKKDNVDKVGLYMLIYFHIPSYTSKYLQIPANSVTYLYIPPHTLKY